MKNKIFKLNKVAWGFVTICFCEEGNFFLMYTNIQDEHINDTMKFIDNQWKACHHGVQKEKVTKTQRQEILRLR